MGNCAPKPKEATLEAVHYTGSPPPPPTPTSTTTATTTAVRLYGPAGCTAMSRIRIALLYKSVAVQFCTTSEGPVLEHGGESVAGSPEVILQYVDAKLPGPRILETGVLTAAPGVAVAVALQHRGMERQLESVVRWAEELAEAAAEGKGELMKRRGGSRRELRGLRRSYAQLVEVMLEHAQMEERVVFPVLEKAERESCRAANEEHARDLPIMNGIKEDIKSIVVLDPCGHSFQEALLSLSLRLRTLQEHCREHFAEEERELLPLVEAAERGRGSWSMDGALEQMVEVMEATHSHLFTYLIAGLLPQEAMRYLDVVCRCQDQRRVAGMLRSLEARLEAAGTAATTPLGSLFKVTTQ